MTPKPSLVEVSISGYRATLTLNDPERRNAMSEEMGVQFSQAISELQKNADIRTVVITGAGAAFSGGGHLEMLEAKTKISREENERLMNAFYRHFLTVKQLPVPVLAAINGHAMGAGLCLALACDLRLANRDAKLGLNFVNLGLHPGMGATFHVPQLIGDARAAELLYTGAIVTAEEAARMGLVNRAVAPAELPVEVEKLTNQIAAGGPIAIRQLKASLHQLRGASLEACLAREASCQAENYIGTEFAEGIAAAREKRKPIFR